MGEPLSNQNTTKLDFSPANAALSKIDLSKTIEFNAYVFGQLISKNKKFGIGGYLEQRAIYGRSPVFALDQLNFRNIHLGIDIWVEAGQPIFVPLPGKVHSFMDNAGFGNYGPTIILEHELDGVTFFTLYGHLMVNDIKLIKVGTYFQAGDHFCHVGPFPENGDWPPHLHFQLMTDMDGNWGDFPGVCSLGELPKFREICLDPDLILSADL